ncbi:MAG: hypothetical protein IT168_20030 [Bryobacterales bacterium]|nr:hypothetical protein [Bryobacterales bacterium]
MSYQATALLAELDPASSRQLTETLSRMGHNPVRTPESIASVDIVFCGTNPISLARMLEAVRRQHRDVPVVAVGHDADTSLWLDMLEQGAADYLCTPCEPIQIDWLFESNLRNKPAPQA